MGGIAYIDKRKLEHAVLRDWLIDHIDDYIEIPDAPALYTVDVNKMALDILEFIWPRERSE